MNNGLVLNPLPGNILYACIISNKEISHEPIAIDGLGSMLVFKLHLFLRKSTNLLAALLPVLSSCFMIYAVAQFLEKASA